MTPSDPSRRGVLRGVSGLAAVSLAGCPKSAPEQAIPVSELLLGTGVTEGAVLSAVRAMSAAAPQSVTLMLQRRRALVLSRDRFGPAVRQQVTHGAVARLVDGDEAREAASNRTEDETLQLLLNRVGVPALAPLTDEAAGPTTRLVPVRVPEMTEPAPAVDVVGASLALVIDGLSLRVPEQVEAVWERVEDDRLWILADGRVVRSVSSWGRLSIDAVFPTASGSIRVHRTAGLALFDSPDGRAVEQEVAAMVQAVTAHGAAVTVSADTRSVLLEADVALLVALAAGRAGWRTPFEEGPWSGSPELGHAGATAGSGVWTGQRVRRVAWNTELEALPRSIRVATPGAEERAEQNREDRLRVVGARIRSADAHSILLVVGEAWVENHDSSRMLRSGLQLRIPRASLERMTLAEAAPRSLRRVVTGTPGASALVLSGLPALWVPGCTVEVPNGGT